MKSLPNDVDRSAVVRAAQARQTISTLKTEIAQTYAQFQESAQNLCEVALANVNTRIKLGCLLLSAKDHAGHGKFQDFVESQCPFSVRSAQRFLNCALAADFKPITSLDALKEFKSVLIELGLKEPESHGPQQLHDIPTPFIALTKSLGTVRRTLSELIENRPLENWDVTEKDQLKVELEPIATLYRSLE